MKYYKQLKVWEKVAAIVNYTGCLLQHLDRDDRLVFVVKANRTVVSIASNMVEGGSRERTDDNARFVTVDLGFSYGLEIQLLVILKLQLLFTGVEQLVIMIDDKQKILLRYLAK